MITIRKGRPLPHLVDEAAVGLFVSAVQDRFKIIYYII